MIGNIYISGQIGSNEDVKGVELIDVISQVNKQKDATRFDVYIDSEGGSVDVGFDIYNYLSKLGKPITTIGSGIVASIATVIFMAGSNRVVRKGTQFMIHMPWSNVAGDADYLEYVAKDLRACEKQMISFYKKTLNLTEEAIKPLLINETWMNQEQLLSLGFVTSSPVMAKARVFIKTDDKMSKPNFKEKLASLKAWAKKELGIQNKIVFDAENNEVDFYELDEDDNIDVGAKATIKGEPAQGKVVMSDGKTYVFEAGELIEILEEYDDQEMAQLKEENEELKQEVEQIAEAFEGIKAMFENLEKENKELKQKNEAYAKAQSRYSVDNKKPRPEDKDKKDKKTSGSAALAAIKAYEAKKRELNKK